MTNTLASRSFDFALYTNLRCKVVRWDTSSMAFHMQGMEMPIPCSMDSVPYTVLMPGLSLVV